ncbi:UDP-N-acetylmuramate dehydrogenase [Haloimpatiens lingqiaonensis]|uniref:UDP-N-acetylmuramate dehydrogenase n=1 Tax=Haloimpatiens lingqiaonensis TaxID=1380675 RepID=UPI0010FE0D30|nr:UDP-N-acetylmuramate dehydrogenase [Haloimpatiens lingqiaonensis]
MNEYKDFSFLIKSILEPEDILLDEPMKNHTSFKVGGPCDILVTPKKCDEIINIIKLCKEHELPYYIIGNGSNLLVKDGGIRGVVIKTSKLNNIEITGERVVAESGAVLCSVSNKAAKAGLTGLEFSSGIPGSIGGAVAMNAGAYDGEISKVIESAVVLNKDGEILEFSKEELELGYRKSGILKYGYIVLKVTFRLHMGDKEKIMNRISELASKRKEKQPLEYPSAGSTFKRPEGYFAGRLIEESNLKGVSVGGAQVSEKHAGFVINKGEATAKDILDLIQVVQKTVKENFGVELQPEVRIIGEE